MKSKSLKKVFNNKGATLMEVIIATTILMLIAGFITAGSSFSTYNNLTERSITETIKSNLGLVRLSAMSNDYEHNPKVVISNENGDYYLKIYIDGVVNTNDAFLISGATNVEIYNGMEIAFAKNGAPTEETKNNYWKIGKTTYCVNHITGVVECY